ncbi:iron chelate uptake ABC transporter family permease subunit [Paenibacillus thiaminolyticus]|uniref:iron chelate uptake ABC transporter family permease subunit n=1 Tax=Paenibacillus TaxID=44249 RepID=UPI001F10978C|nr:iron chelate uptake ABC transporter family permease subunit [Paenibacillus dendritiformis]
MSGIFVMHKVFQAPINNLPDFSVGRLDIFKEGIGNKLLPQLKKGDQHSCASELTLSRWLIGNDHRLLLPFSGLLGAAFLLLADLSSRFLLEAKEVPVGVTTAVLGVPFVVVLIRRKALGQS